MNWNSWRTAITPELDTITAADRAADGIGGIKIVFDDEIGGNYSQKFAGMAGDLLSAAFGHLGPTIVISPPNISENCLPDTRYQAATATAVHELAHCFDFASLNGRVPLNAKSEEVLAYVRKEIGKRHLADQEAHYEAGIDHAAFVRRSIHLAGRLVRRGWQVPLVYLHDWTPPAAWDAFHALADELDSLQSRSIREVDRIPPPPEFVALFESRQAA